VKIVAQVKLLPGRYEADALAATLRACNRAANHASRIAYETGAVRRGVLQTAVYHDLKQGFDLGAQAAVRTVGKVCEAYASLAGLEKSGRLAGKALRRAKSKPIGFRDEAAQPYDDRMLSWNLVGQSVSIWTTAGRLKGVRFVCSSETLALLQRRRGESDLISRDGMFFLIATIDLPDAPVYEPADWLGVDMGIVNIVTTSDGEIASGRRLERYRQRMRRNVEKLQAKKTKSAKRALKRLRRREARFAADTNHRISKQLVHTAERTSRGIALEDLKGIRTRVTAKHDQRYRLHSWAFAQLGEFIEYKAARAGVPVVHVDPRNTSRQCSGCWHTHRSNRASQSWFACRSCGTVMNADLNASRNIRHRADVVWQRGKVNCPSPTLTG
jgi:IS605 OrfB family transposase